MTLKICENCGKRKKYYSPAFGRYKCYNCGKETPHITSESGAVISANRWWSELSPEEKVRIHEKFEK